MDLALADKVVWITGASGGIGRALAEVFGAEGCALGLQAHQGADSLREWLAAQPFRKQALVLEADIRDTQAVDRAASELAQRFGRIDVCAANAGVWPVEDTPLDRMDPGRLADTVGVNLLGSLHTAAAFLRELRRTGPRSDGHGAALVFTGSTAGRFGERDHVDYAAAKAGLVGAMHSLKNELVRIDPHGRVNLVEPGWTVTHMARPALDVPGAVERAVRTMALRQLGRAVDVARSVAFLASPTAASHLSGQTLTVAGGMEGRLLWNEDEVERGEILARLERD